jgi:hypothetical protein
MAGKTLPIYMLSELQARRAKIEGFINLLPFILRNYEEDECALLGISN